MRFSLRSRKNWESTVEVDSVVLPGVRYRLVRMSLERRGHLIRAIRELAGKAEFHAAGGVDGKLESSALALDIDAVYLRWGLAGIEGLAIDGKEASPELLIARGPEALAREMVAGIKRECALSEEERKN